MPPCTEPKLTTAGCFEMLLRRLTTVCAVPTRSAAATIGSTPPHGAEPCVWRPWTSMVNLSDAAISGRSEEHTSELQSLMRISYAVFCLKKKKYNITQA